MEIVLIGLNHRTASVEVRERVAFTPEQAREAAGQLRSRGILEESLVLSTCNRSELYGVPREDATDSAGAVELFVASFHQLSLSELDGSLYRHRDSNAVRHLFRVSAGLDSMLLGEAEILGQVRDAYQIALDRGETGPVLNRMFQAALEVGKRVRNETELGTRPVSVAFSGVKLAERIFGKLNNHRALIVGSRSDQRASGAAPLRSRHQAVARSESHTGARRRACGALWWRSRALGKSGRRARMAGPDRDFGFRQRADLDTLHHRAGHGRPWQPRAAC